MIIGDRRAEVVENIRKAANERNLNAKVEVNDPKLTTEQSAALVERYIKRRDKVSFKAKSYCSRKIVNTFTKALNKETEIIGIENMDGIKGGAIITCNHFNPVDNTAVRTLVRRLGKKRINIVSQETNLAMTGMVGFLMNYSDTIPISQSASYMQRDFLAVIKGLLENDEFVLIYPEQEMWFNYRKPRSLKRGAYYYAAKLGSPVISCFVEIQDLEENDTEEFKKVKYVLHILPTIYPDPNKTVKENSVIMCEQDFNQKKEAYEKAYGKELNYDFEYEDIAGWIGES